MGRRSSWRKNGSRSEFGHHFSPVASQKQQLKDSNVRFSVVHHLAALRKQIRLVEKFEESKNSASSGLHDALPRRPQEDVGEDLNDWGGRFSFSPAVLQLAQSADVGQ